MKTLKFRVGAIAAAGALAAVTFLGALALQDDGHGSNERIGEGSPIVYSGGYGLFPVAE
jgi:hypothetical protein